MKHGMLVAIVGPTATGKTAVGIELARQLDGEIVSADSMAVYKFMDIGTAKPAAEEQAEVRFHLIDVVYPDQDFSVAEFRRLAEEAIEDILARGKVPILVGGTGLYIKAVTEGMSIPQVGPDRALRGELKAQAEQFGNQHLLDQLAAVDPITAGRLHVNDQKRIIRALEVYRISGQPVSHYHQVTHDGSGVYHSKLFGLTMSRAALYARIEARVEEQVAAGLVEEVRSLLAKGYSSDLPSMRGLDYKQMAGYLCGQYDFGTAVELLKRDTRRYAKRQFTWFNAVPEIHWVDVEGRSAAEVSAEIMALLKAKV